MAREITYNNFEISLVVFIPNITTNHAITYTNDFVLEPHAFHCLVSWLTLELGKEVNEKTEIKRKAFTLQAKRAQGRNQKFCKGI